MVTAVTTTAPAMAHTHDPVSHNRAFALGVALNVGFVVTGQELTLPVTVTNAGGVSTVDAALDLDSVWIRNCSAGRGGGLYAKAEYLYTDYGSRSFLLDEIAGDLKGLGYAKSFKKA